MKVTFVEGSPAEIAEAFPHFNLGVAAVAVKTTAPIAIVEATNGSNRKFVSVDVARLLLKRRALRPTQLIVLKTLYEAGDGWTLTPTLSAKVNYTRPEFSGLMGAFGRRLTHTPGYIKGTWFFDQEWNYDADCYEYRLPESVRSALEAERIV